MTAAPTYRFTRSRSGKESGENVGAPSGATVGVAAGTSPGRCGKQPRTENVIAITTTTNAPERGTKARLAPSSDRGSPRPRLSSPRGGSAEVFRFHGNRMAFYRDLSHRLRIPTLGSGCGSRSGERRGRRAAMALLKPTCTVNCLEEAHVRRTIVGMRTLAFSFLSRRDSRHDRGPHRVHPCRTRRRTCRAARARTWRGTSAASASTCGHPTRH
jgi:hypothetical protein